MSFEKEFKKQDSVRELIRNIDIKKEKEKIKELEARQGIDVYGKVEGLVFQEFSDFLKRVTNIVNAHVHKDTWGNRLGVDCRIPESTVLGILKKLLDLDMRGDV